MTIKIIEPQVVDPSCKTQTFPQCDHRNTVYRGQTLEKLERVVKDRDVVELGCGLFGGLSELALKFGCKSYRGINLCRGNPTKDTYAIESRFSYEIVFAKRVPLEVTIPEGLANRPNVDFIFGTDFLTFLRQVKEGSCVTISTGFFHDALLTPNGMGKDYIESGVSEIARVTQKGEFVGLHHFMLDEGSNPSLNNLTQGKYLIPLFRNAGLEINPVEDIDDPHINPFWYLNKR